MVVSRYSLLGLKQMRSNHLQDFNASSVFFLWHQVNAKLKAGSKIPQHTRIHKTHKVYRDSSSNKHLVIMFIRFGCRGKVLLVILGFTSHTHTHKF